MKSLEKMAELTKDDISDSEKEIQEITNKYINLVDQSVAAKEKRSSNNLMAKPKSLAIVMDGNRRWAKKNNLPISQGHRAGIESLTRIVKHAKNIGVKHLVVYAFSTENWNRKQFEVNALMNLINFGADTKLNELIDNEVKLNFIGDLDVLPLSSRKAIDKCIESTKKFESFTLTVAVNYGGIWDFINTITKAKDRDFFN